MKGKSTMSIQKQTAEFIATFAQNMPEMSSDIMQGWIENPSALQKALRSVLVPPQNGTKSKVWTKKVWQIDTKPRGETERESNKFFDSGDELTPLRVCMYNTREGVRLNFSSSDKRDESQRFEFVINDETHSIVSFKPDPEVGEMYAEVMIDRDEWVNALEKAKKFIQIYRLERCE